jgi:alkylation response protein AidB-like acyl-CoA dehydrogenase
MKSTDTGAESRHSELMGVCQELAKGFEARAADHDRDGSFPVDNFDDLKQAGLLGIMVPEKDGGWGADFLTYAQAVEILATGDAATALAFNMHNIAIGSLAEAQLTDSEDRRTQAVQSFREWAFQEAVVHNKVFASASSEPGVGAHFSKLQTTYERSGNGFVLNGTKSWVSMAGFADYYVVAARAKTSKASIPSVSFFVVDRDAPGVRAEDIWDVLGMRSTSTNPVHFEDCYVPKERLFMASEGMVLYKISREPHWVVGAYNGVYLGIMTASLEFLVELLSKKKQPGTEVPLAEDPLVQRDVGRLYAYLCSARLAVHHAARLVDDARGSAEANTAIHHAKFLVSELGPRLTSEAIRLCGATALSRRLPLERHYRDSRCGGLMPATSDECLAYLGRAAFGVNLGNPTKTYW